MDDNLYQEATGQSTVTTSTPNNTAWMNLTWFDLGVFVYSLNYLALAWTIFYSILLVRDFFFYRVKYNDYELEREQMGVKSIMAAVNLWYSYLFALLLFGVFVFTPAAFAAITGWIAVFAYLFKIFIADMPDIPVLGNILGFPGKEWDSLVQSTWKGFQTMLGDFLTYVSKIFGG